MFRACSLPGVECCKLKPVRRLGEMPDADRPRLALNSNGAARRAQAAWHTNHNPTEERRACPTIPRMRAGRSIHERDTHGPDPGAIAQHGQADGDRSPVDLTRAERPPPHRLPA